MPRLVEAGYTLRAQVNAKWPNRDKNSDGWIGDSAHAARPSDHNPDAQGWVHALDIDKDGIDADAFADQLIAHCRARAIGSDRIKNVVFRDRVASGTYPGQFWVWRPGDYGHQGHIHVSFTDAAERNGAKFPLPCLAAYPPPAPYPGKPIGWPSPRSCSAGPPVATIQRALRVPVTSLFNLATRNAVARWTLTHPGAALKDRVGLGAVGPALYASILTRYPA